MDAKKKTLIALLGTLGMVLAVPSSIGILAFSLPSVYGNTFYGGMKDKLALLEKKQDNRIIVVGGSSVPFSLDCTLIKQELPDYNPIDFGLYASLGTSMMIDLVYDSVQKGDIVILSPEQSSQTLSTYFNAVEAWKALDGDLGYIWKINGDDRASMLGSLPGYVADKARYLNQGIPDPDGIYRHASFNEYGDISAERIGNIMEGGLDSNAKISFDEDIISKDFIAKMNAFGTKCWEKGAKLYYRFAPMNREAIDEQSKLDGYYDYLNNSINFPIMGDPRNSVLEKEWFYDTNYHLNSSGAIKYTKELIRDIKLLLKDTSKTNIDDPVMPPLAPQEDYHGDDSDSGCFLFEKKGDAYFIVGLSDQGKTKTRLILPTYYDEMPVKGFAATLFQDNHQIEEIVIQRNIRRIEDHSFASSSLKRLILDINDPSLIAVGDKLLDGCSADIYVRKEKLNDFLVNYFWAPYADRIKALD